MDDDYVLSNLAMSLSASHQPETTALSSGDEAKFQRWAQDNGVKDVDAPNSHYDMRGYWQSTNGAPHEAGQHFPDTFKQHGHPTFSAESRYSRGPQDGGRWIGGALVRTPMASHTPVSVTDTSTGVTRQLAPLPSHLRSMQPLPSHVPNERNGFVRAQTPTEQAANRVRDVYDAADRGIMQAPIVGPALRLMGADPKGVANYDPQATMGAPVPPGPGENTDAEFIAAVRKHLRDLGTHDPSPQPQAEMGAALMENLLEDDYTSPILRGQGKATMTRLAPTLAERLLKPGSGFTVHAVTGREPTTGFAVGMYPDRTITIPKDAPGDQVIRSIYAFFKRNNELLTMDDRYLGGWKDPEGHVVLDVVQQIRDRAAAQASARNAGQSHYYDFGLGRAFPVGDPEPQPGK